MKLTLVSTIQSIPNPILEKYSLQALKYITLYSSLWLFWGTVPFHILFWHVDLIELFVLMEKSVRRNSSTAKKGTATNFITYMQHISGSI